MNTIQQSLSDKTTLSVMYTSYFLKAWKSILRNLGHGTILPWLNYIYIISRWNKTVNIKSNILAGKIKDTHLLSKYSSPSLIRPLPLKTTPLIRPQWAPAQDRQNFVQACKFFSFYLELHTLYVYKNKFKNLIRTSIFKFSFQGLLIFSIKKMLRVCLYTSYFLKAWKSILRNLGHGTILPWLNYIYIISRWNKTVNIKSKEK
jgi:hypothetical protein